MDNNDWHETPVRVRYGETDQMGVVYHANYLVYFEMGRTELIRSLGRSYSEVEGDGVKLIVVEATCRYHSPARYDEELRIRTRVASVRSVRVDFEYEIVGADGGIRATGRTRLAAVDAAGKPTRLPSHLSSMLS